jgi:hypothetical protein
MPIVFTEEDDENAWCDDCDALLIPRKDESMICSNPQCGRQYLPDSINKHKRRLRPDKSRYDNNDGPELVPLTGYGSYAKQKKPTVFDREDRAFESKSGRYFTSEETWLPEGEGGH